MSESTASLRHKIDGAGELQSVVRTMKAMAASSIGQYERSVHALADYYRTVELGLVACLREDAPAPMHPERKSRTVAGPIGAVVFGSDQGLVGQFNDVVADYAIETLAALPGRPKLLPEVVGGRAETLRKLISEYLFVSLFRACAESLASENASRLAAMKRADKNINELLEGLNRTFHRLRQSSIDEELFDVVSGFESLPSEQRGPIAH